MSKVYLTPQGFASTKATNSFINIRYPEFDKILVFFDGNLVVKCMVSFKDWNGELVYHPGAQAARDQGMLWLIGTALSIAGFIVLAQGHVEKTLKLSKEQGALIASLPASIAAGDIIRSGGNSAKNAATAWHYLRDPKLFANEGYYNLETKPPTLMIKGKVTKEKLFDA